MFSWLRLGGVTLVAGVLAGCSTFADIEAGLADLRGKPIDAAVYQLGYPTNKITISGENVYTWSNQNSGSYTMPQNNIGYGYAGTIPFSYNYTTYQTQSYDYYCIITIVTDEKDVIIKAGYEGNIGGCTRYSRRLAPKG
ncbi:MAG: hypothetical protein H6R00_3460 [Proteobacteria bacterium]|nr:hypothetical protein [Pseudomonadota bacterium]